MGRFKIKKQDTFIDMTPMSDVMVLLLTFFMLTATFVKDEPVKVNVPGSVSEVKIPESNLLTIFVEKEGKVFMTLDTPSALRGLVSQMAEMDAMELTPQETQEFADMPTFGTPISTMSAWLGMERAKRTEYLLKGADAGIPCDSLNNELKIWVKAARKSCGEGMRIAIKADQNTSYSVIKKVMDSLRELDENRYNLITALKAQDAE